MPITNMIPTNPHITPLAPMDGICGLYFKCTILANTPPIIAIMKYQKEKVIEPNLFSNKEPILYKEYILHKICNGAS